MIIQVQHFDPVYMRTSLISKHVLHGRLILYGIEKILRQFA